MPTRERASHRVRPRTRIRRRMQIAGGRRDCSGTTPVASWPLSLWRTCTRLTTSIRPCTSLGITSRPLARRSRWKAAPRMAGKRSAGRPGHRRRAAGRVPPRVPPREPDRPNKPTVGGWRHPLPSVMVSKRPRTTPSNLHASEGQENRSAFGTAAAAAVSQRPQSLTRAHVQNELAGIFRFRAEEPHLARKRDSRIGQLHTAFSTIAGLPRLLVLAQQ